jgi:hypothetical protein
VLTAVESILTLDGEFWRQRAQPDAQARTESGELRADWRKRGFLRGYTDERYTFGRYFSPYEPNRRVIFRRCTRPTTSCSPTAAWTRASRPTSPMSR